MDLSLPKNVDRKLKSVPQDDRRGLLKGLHEMAVTLAAQFHPLMVCFFLTHPNPSSTKFFFSPSIPPVLEQKSKESFTLSLK